MQKTLQELFLKETKTDKMKVFTEQQKFTQSFMWFVHILNFGLLVLMSYALFQQLILGKPFGDKPAPDVVLILSFLLVLAITVFLFMIKLTSRIDEKGINYQFFPFHFSMKKIEWNEIQKAYVRKYSPISEYGGWGIKGGFLNSKGKAINVSGNIGIQLELKNGKKLLIGTQKENEAKQVLKTYQSKISETGN